MPENCLSVIPQGCCHPAVCAPSGITALLLSGPLYSFTDFGKGSFVAKKKKALNPLRLTGPSIPAWLSVPKQAQPLLLVRSHLYPSSKNKMQ